VLNLSRVFCGYPRVQLLNPFGAMNHRQILGLSPVNPTPSGNRGKPKGLVAQKNGANGAKVPLGMATRTHTSSMVESPPPTKVQLDMITTSGVRRVASATTSSAKTCALSASKQLSSTPAEKATDVSPLSPPPDKEPITTSKSKPLSLRAVGKQQVEEKTAQPPAKRQKISRLDAKRAANKDEVGEQADSDGSDGSDSLWAPTGRARKSSRSSRWKDPWSCTTGPEADEEADEEEADEEADEEEDVGAPRAIVDEVFTDFPGRVTPDEGGDNDGAGYRGGGYLGGGDDAFGVYDDHDDDVEWDSPDPAHFRTDHPFRGLSHEELRTVCSIATRELTARCSRNCRAPNKLERGLRSAFLRVFPLPTYSVVNHTLSRQNRVWSGEENAWLISMVDATRIAPGASSPGKVFQIPWKGIHKVYCREFPAAARKYHVTKEVLQYRYRFILDGLKEGRVNLGTGEVSRKTAFALG
jgi:hypothetical protein